METKVFAASIAIMFGLCSIGLITPRTNGPGDLCSGVGIVLCHFLPVAPELDEDIDLTQQLNTGDGAAAPNATAPRADTCAAGCA